MNYNRTHMEKPGAERRVMRFVGTVQYESRCGLTVYAVQPNEKLVTCRRCLEAARKQRRAQFAERVASIQLNFSPEDAFCILTDLIVAARKLAAQEGK